jgi:hypothetical protein
MALVYVKNKNNGTTVNVNEKVYHGDADENLDF